MKKYVIACSLIILVFLILSITASSSIQVESSISYNTISVTGGIEEIVIPIDGTTIETSNINSDKQLSMKVKLVKEETGKSYGETYSYNIPSNGQIELRQSVSISGFSSSDFPTDQSTNMRLELIANHPDINRKVSSTEITVIRDINRVSCEAIQQNNSDATSGVYKLDPDGDGGVAPFNVYCEMDENGGGWIKLQLDSSVDKNGDNMLWFSKYNTVGSQRSVHGSIGKQFDWSQLNQLSDETQLNNDFSDDGTTYYPEMDNGVTRNNEKINYEMAGETGLTYTDDQIEAIRQNITQLSNTTRMFTHTNDDDGCDPNGEIYTRLSDGGTTYHMTPYTSGNQVTKSQYWNETDFGNTEYLLPTYIDYGDYDNSGCSGSVDHMSWGWEQDYILVK